MFMFLFGLIALVLYAALVAFLCLSAMLAVVVAAGAIVLLRFRHTRIAGALTASAAVTGAAAFAAAYAVLMTVLDDEIRAGHAGVAAVVGFAWSGLGAAALTGGAALVMAGVRRFAAAQGPLIRLRHLLPAAWGEGS
jgi:hypothetical protein